MSATPFFVNEAISRRFVVDGIFDAASYHRWLKNVTAHPDSVKPFREPLWAVIKRELRSKDSGLGCSSLYIGFWCAGVLSIPLGLLGIPYLTSCALLTPVFFVLSIMYFTRWMRSSDQKRWEEGLQYARRVHQGTIIQGTVTRAALVISSDGRFSQRDDRIVDYLVARLEVDYRFQAGAFAYAGSYKHEISRDRLDFGLAPSDVAEELGRERERKLRETHGGRVPPLGAPVYVLYLSQSDYALL